MPDEFLFLVPLVGGYRFLTNWNRTKFEASRYSGHRLIFHAALWALLLGMAAYLLSRTLIYLINPPVVRLWMSLVPFEYVGTALLALALGEGLPAWLNKCKAFDERTQLEKAIEKSGDALEQLIARALDRGMLVSLSTRGRKFYVGVPVDTPKPDHAGRYITILPWLSGYRDETSLTFVPTTDYLDVYDWVIASRPRNLEVDDFVVVLPRSEIVTANLFDTVAFSRFGGEDRAAAREPQ